MTVPIAPGTDLDGDVGNDHALVDDALPRAVPLQIGVHGNLI